MCWLPSFAAAVPERVTVGATLLMVTTWVAAGPVAPSESVALALTVELFGPSAKVHWKQPPVSVNVSDHADLVAVGAARRRHRGDGVGARVGDRVAVGVRRSLVDGQVVKRREGHRRGDVGHGHGDRVDVAGGAIGVGDAEADGRAGRAVREGAVEAAAGGGRRE